MIKDTMELKQNKSENKIELKQEIKETVVVEEKEEIKEMEEKEEDIETKVYQILGYIGLNKILSFKEDKEGNLEVIIGGEEMALVLAKVVLYLLMSFQLLIA